jgi:integrase-like protein
VARGPCDNSLSWVRASRRYRSAVYTKRSAEASANVARAAAAQVELQRPRPLVLATFQHSFSQSGKTPLDRSFQFQNIGDSPAFDINVSPIETPGIVSALGPSRLATETIRYLVPDKPSGGCIHRLEPTGGALRSLEAYEAADSGLLSPDLAAGIRRVKGAKRLGVWVGNWLTVDQAHALLQRPSADSLRAKRDRAMLALLLGCGLRRAELVGLRHEDLQIREDHWIIADLIGKGRHIRTVPVPSWAKAAVDDWSAAAKPFGK